MLNIDTFLTIGSQHSVCEDYVLSGTHQLHYVILSDGCSSSPNTEMGSRILCYLARQYIRYRFTENPDTFYLDYDEMGKWIIHNAEMTARQLGLPRTCLDATLMVSYCNPIDYKSDPTVNILIYGDGFIVLVPKDGPVQICEVEFKPDNMPFYLSYYLDSTRLQAYHERKVSKFYNATREDITKYYWSDEYAYDFKIKQRLKVNEYKAILLFSDGLKSFIKKDRTHREIIQISDVIAGLVSFKNIKGKFLQRRVSKELKSLAENDIVHYDDLSIGAYVNEELWDGNIQLNGLDGSPSVPTEVS